MEKNQLLCNCDIIHEETINSVIQEMPNINHLKALTDFYKVIGDLTRIRILSVLSIRELCVCDIAAILEMTKSAISHQLKTLRLAKLVKFRRQGKEIYYSLDDEHIKNIINQGLTHVLEK
jgi:ArsR family transcriptional regulator